MFQGIKLNAKANLIIWRQEYFFLSAIAVMLLLSLTINSIPIKLISSITLFLFFIQYKKSLWETVKYGTSPMCNFLTLKNTKKLYFYNFVKWILLIVPLCLSILSIIYWFILVGVTDSYIYNLSVFVICLAIFFIGLITFIYMFYSYRLSNYLLYLDNDITLKAYFEKSREEMQQHKVDLLKLDISFFFWHFLSILSLAIGYSITLPYIELSYINWADNLIQSKTLESFKKE